MLFVTFKGVNNEDIKGEVIMSEVRLKRLANKMKTIDEFAFDTETDTLRVQGAGIMSLVGISICFGEFNNYYIPVGHYFDEGQLELETVVKYLKPIFEREDIRIIGHNLKFDMHVMANIGISIKTNDIFDTMVARWITNENKDKGLKAITADIYNVPQSKIDECLKTVTKEEKKEYGLKASNKAPFLLVRIPVGAPYALADTYWTWRHYCDWQLEELKNEGMETIFYKVQMPFLRTLFNMERRGVRIDIEKLKEMQKRAEKDLEDLHYRMIEIAGVEFNPSSNQQLAELLFGYKKVNKNGEFVGNVDILECSFNFPIQSTTSKGVPQTGDSVLNALSKLNYKKDKRKKEGVELIKLLLKYKKLNKLKTSFMDGLLKQIYPDGKVHPTFNIVGTDSGRLSCQEPNLQQLPRPVELDMYLSFEDWAKENKVELSKKALKVFSEDLFNKKLGYITGELVAEDVPEEIKQYAEYIKEWRAENEENIFWKSYEIRDVFIPDDPENEVVVALDFSNLEMRLLAHFSKDPKLTEAFINDEDAHGATAVNMFNLDCTPKEAKKLYPHLRQIAKTINFMLMYGGSAFTLYRTLAEEEAKDENGNLITKEKAQEYYDKYFEAYSGVAEFIKNQRKFAHKHEVVFTVIGRKRRLEGINSNDYKMMGYYERLAINAPIQGSGGDIMMMCQPKIENDKRLKELGCTMRLQVHDKVC